MHKTHQAHPDAKHKLNDPHANVVDHRRYQRILQRVAPRKSRAYDRFHIPTNALADISALTELSDQ